MIEMITVVQADAGTSDADVTWRSANADLETPFVTAALSINAQQVPSLCDVATSMYVHRNIRAAPCARTASQPTTMAAADWRLRPKRKWPAAPPPRQDPTRSAGRTVLRLRQPKGSHSQEHTLNAWLYVDTPRKTTSRLRLSQCGRGTEKENNSMNRCLVTTLLSD